MLTAIILTYNEEKHLPDCLASVAWAPQVIVFDRFSTDRTVEIAQAAGARIFQREFDSFAGQRNAALEAADSEWVLFVDADERVTPGLAEEVRGVLDRAEAGWWIPRHNYIFGRLTRYAGWYPDYQMRLLRRSQARYDPARPVHELVILDSALPAGRLREPFIHLNYDSPAEFVAKQKYYAGFDARRLLAEGVRARPRHFVLQPLRQLLWRLITLQGWRDGLHGLRLCALMAYFELEKYRQLRRLQHTNLGNPTSQTSAL